MKFSYFGSFLIDTDQRPIDLSHALRVSSRFNRVLSSWMTKWKVSAIQQIIRNSGEPVSISILAQAFVQKCNKRFWPQQGLKKWLVKQFKSFVFGIDHGEFKVSISGIEFPQPTPPTPDSWYISEGLSPPQRDVYVPVDPIVDPASLNPKKRHRRSRKRKNPPTEDETQPDE